jgi:MoaA/NifB/PqqE/SkfB family radical SAM enzyme
MQPSDRGIMTRDTFMHIIPILKEVGTLNLDNHGEPLLNPELEWIIEEARKAAPHLNITLTSNFQLMTRDRAISLLRAGLNELQVSVNGVRKSTYEKIMKGSSFDRLTEHMQDFAEVRKKFPDTFRLFCACTTIMKSNIDELVMVPGFVSQFGVNVLRINAVLPFNRNMQEESLYDRPGLKDKMKSILQETREEGRRRNVTVTHVTMENTSCICRYPVKNFSVSYDGTVSFCWMLDIPNGYHFYNQNDIARLPFHSFGNINKQSIVELWSSEPWRHLREEFASGNLPDYCRKCPVGEGRICG